MYHLPLVTLLEVPERNVFSKRFLFRLVLPIGFDLKVSFHHNIH